MEVATDDFDAELLYVSGGCGLYPRQRGKREPTARFLVRIADRYLAKGRTGKAFEVYRLALKAEPGNDAAKQAFTQLGIELSNPATRQAKPWEDHRNLRIPRQWALSTC